MAEPDLIVLGGQINGVPDSVFIMSVSDWCGLGACRGIFKNFVPGTTFIHTDCLLFSGIRIVLFHR